MTIQSCRICKSQSLYPFLSLGTQPLADRFPADLSKTEPRFDLDVMVCDRCHLVQLTTVVEKELVFGDDYAFYTGASPSSIEYFKEYASLVKKYFHKQASGFVLEIASNDGTLLKEFKGKTLGIDPARNVVQEAKANGIETMCDYFTKATARKIQSGHGKADLIIANNVLAHVDDLHDFIDGVKGLLAEDGVFIFEVHYFPNLLFKSQWDNVYHEHLSYFSLSPLEYLLKDHGLAIFQIHTPNTQGGSIRVHVKHINQTGQVTNTVKYLRAFESNIRLHETITYSGFQARVDYEKYTLLSMLEEYHSHGFGTGKSGIAGYGAAAKGNTLLNYCGIGTQYLDYIVDKTPYKIGKYSPGMHIPIVAEEKDKANYYLMLAWNYEKGILEREKGRFIIPHLPRIV